MAQEKKTDTTEGGNLQLHKSYSGFYKTTAEIFYPEDTDRIRQIFSLAQEQKRKVAFRGEGYSFDSQGLNNDLLVSLRRLTKINVNPTTKQVTVGSGAIWADILKAVQPFNLVPAVMVSTGFTCAGGTLSANCMSRFSPIWGKEGKWIDSFEIVTADGVVRNCSRTEHADLFYAAIGGFGSFGAITRITYNLVSVPELAKIKTVVIRKDNHADLHKDVLPGENKTQTVYSAFGIVGDRIRTMTCICEYKSEPKLVPMVPHQPQLKFRTLTEFMIHWFPSMGQLFWNYAYSVYTRFNDTYIDAIDGYTFFMDGNVRAKKLGDRLGMEFKAVQQTFVFPASEQNLNYFLAETLKILGAANMPPAMIDVLYLPQDEHFLLSSTNGLSGYALSMAFSAMNDDKCRKIKAALEELTELCLELKGKVHLTKNVLSKPEHVQAMYKDSLDEFFSIRKKYDPTGILKNDFIDRIFPDYINR